jgi:pimeloyl-ACP methyl ester carboxylesterase
MWDDPLLARGLRQLADVGRLITCDGRGWGSSDPVDLDHIPALQTWMDDIGIVLDEVGSVRAALVAMDVSALPVLLFAAAHPERTYALALMNAFARFARDHDYLCGMPSEALERWIEGYRRAVGTGAISDVEAPSRASDAYPSLGESRRTPLDASERGRRTIRILRPQRRARRPAQRLGADTRSISPRKPCA